MKIVSEASLANFPQRIQYLREFIGFTVEDEQALHASKPVVAPLVPVVVDTVYEKLLSFSVTAKAFVPRQTGYKGTIPTKVQELSGDHPQIKFRKDFLARYLGKLVTMDYSDIASWEYLDKVGLMHTGNVGFAHREAKPPLRVEYMHCSILLGYVEDILLNAVMTHPDLDDATKTAVLRAFNKIVWIQNDLFARHYLAEGDAAQARSGSLCAVAKPTLLGLASLGVIAVATAFQLGLRIARS